MAIDRGLWINWRDANPFKDLGKKKLVGRLWVQIRIPAKDFSRKITIQVYLYYYHLLVELRHYVVVSSTEFCNDLNVGSFNPYSNEDL